MPLAARERGDPVHENRRSVPAMAFLQQDRSDHLGCLDAGEASLAQKVLTDFVLACDDLVLCRLDARHERRRQRICRPLQRRDGLVGEAVSGELAAAHRDHFAVFGTPDAPPAASPDFAPSDGRPCRLWRRCRLAKPSMMPPRGDIPTLQSSFRLGRRWFQVKPRRPQSDQHLQAGRLMNASTADSSGRPEQTKCPKVASAVAAAHGRISIRR
jgi:hypothetical protein